MTEDRVHALAEMIWHYHHLGHPLERADAILLLGSHDPDVARYAAGLVLAQWAPLLICSGGLGAITRRLWREPEADQFARIATGLGVPVEKILIENGSTNTGENVAFTRRLLAQRGLAPRSFLVVHTPYMERRSYATFRKVWPEPRVIVSSPPASFDDYLAHHANPALSRDDVIGIMVGDLQRLRVYPQRGFQIPQEIPADVWAAGEELIRLGYDRYLAPTDRAT